MSPSPSTSTLIPTTPFAHDHPRLDLIFNEISGKGDPEIDLRTIHGHLNKSFSDINVWKTSATRSGYEAAKEAIENGACVLIACGGDGTVAAVAAAIKQHTALKNSNSVSTGDLLLLGVIPRGTANALCAALHIPHNLVDALDLIINGPTRRLDFPNVNVISNSSSSTTTPPTPHIIASSSIPKSMLLLCGIGLEAETVRRASRRLKKAIGAAAYAVAGLETIWRQSRFQTHLTIQDCIQQDIPFKGATTRTPQTKLLNLRVHGVTIANAAPPASVLAQGMGNVCPDDGLLEIVCVTSSHPLGMIGTMLSMLWGALVKRPPPLRLSNNIFGLRAKQVLVECTPPQPVVIDGEPAGLTPVLVTLDIEHVNADSIHVIAPKAVTVRRRNNMFSVGLVRLVRNVRGLALFAIAMSWATNKCRS